MKKQKLKIGIDCDDVIMLCNEVIIQKYNELNNTNKKLEDIKGWNQKDELFDFKMICFNDPKFVATQPLYEGAQKFMKELCKKAELFITSAVPPQCMSARAMQIVEFFPWIPQDHIILGASKGLYDLDMLLDDGSHNIKASIAKYPVLFRRPWNTDLSGVLSVNTYDDFLHIVDLIYESYADPDLSNGGVICLVGPSGSGKTAIMTELVKEDNFVKPLTATTRAQREGEPDDAYQFVSESEFIEAMNNNAFLETTMYSNHYYGTSTKEIDKIIKKNKFAVIPIDICGAIAIKNKYRNKVILLFIDRDKGKVISEIINRDTNNDEKVRRILSLDKEYENEVFCDEVVNNDSSLSSAVKKIKNIIKRVA